MFMVKRKNKILFVALYVLLLCSFLFLIFNHYSFEDLKTFEFIKHTKYWLSSYTENSIWYREIFASSIIFILFGLIWVFFLGFGSPLAIFAGMYFGLIYGTIITIITLTIGSTALYLAAKYFASDIIEKIFFKKYKNNKLIQRFHNNELKFFIVYRFSKHEVTSEILVSPYFCLVGSQITKYLFPRKKKIDISDTDVSFFNIFTVDNNVNEQSCNFVLQLPVHFTLKYFNIENE